MLWGLSEKMALIFLNFVTKMGENKVKGGKTVSYFEILTHNLMYEWIFWPRDQDHFFFNITHSSFLAGLNMKDLKSFEAKKKKKKLFKICLDYWDFIKCLRQNNYRFVIGKLISRLCILYVSSLFHIHSYISKEVGKPVLKVLIIINSSCPKIISKLGYLACACWPIIDRMFTVPSK